MTAADVLMARPAGRGCVLVLAITGALTAVGLAQQPGGAAEVEPPASPAPVSAGERARAEAMLRRHAERSRDVHVLAADYVQRRTTALSARPLLSSGTFVFVEQPPCVVFRAVEPRVSIVRLLPDRYEVYRPERQRLERFLLSGQELAQGLFSALGGDADRLQRDFAIAGCRERSLPAAPPAADPAAPGDPAAPDAPAPAPPVACVEIRLAPRSAAVRERLRELVITLVAADAELRVVAYRDPSGDLVEIELSHLRIDPESPPAVDFDVPAGTRIIEHAAGERSGR